MSNNTSKPLAEKKKHFEAFRRIFRQLKDRTKIESKTGKEYFDPPLTMEECDAMENQLLEIHHHLLPNPYNLPRSQSCLEALYRIAPEVIPSHLRITADDLKSAGISWDDVKPLPLPPLQFTPPVRKKVDPLPLP